MGRYYLVHMTEFYDRLCGVIAMMAAIFTVTWMQRNNELLATLAAGISTRRTIRPVLVCAVIVSGLAVVNQEFILADLGEEMQKPPDDDGQRTVTAYSRIDVNKIVIHGTYGFREARAVAPFHATFDVTIFGKLVVLESPQARYIPDDDPLG